MAASFPPDGRYCTGLNLWMRKQHSSGSASGSVLWRYHFVEAALMEAGVNVHGPERGDTWIRLGTDLREGCVLLDMRACSEDDAAMVRRAAELLSVVEGGEMVVSDLDPNHPFIHQ